MWLISPASSARRFICCFVFYFYLGVFCFTLVTATSKHLFLVVFSHLQPISIHSLYVILRKYDSCPTMPSSAEFVLTSSSSQPSTLGVGLVLDGDIRANEVTIEEQRSAKQICDEDRKRFQKLYEEERQLERTKQLCHRLPTKITPLSEEVRARQIEEQKRAKEFCNEERERFKQLYNEERQPEGANRTVHSRREDVEDRGLARRRAWEEQRAKDNELLERCRLEKLRDAELRKLRLQQGEQRRRISQARDDSITGDILRHKASVYKPILVDLLGLTQVAFYRAYRMAVDARRGTTEMRLVSKLCSVTKLPSRLKRPSRNHSQRVILLPLIVSFHLSLMRSTSI
jgi:hypothetical protein